MTFRLGCAPIVWNNEDQRGEFGPLVGFERVLDEVAEAGFQGTELGAGFPLEPAPLRRALAARGLELTSAWCGLELVSEDAASDLELTRARCALLAETGASFVNLAHQGTPERSAWAGRAQAADAPRLQDAEWARLAERVNQAAEIAGEYGLQAAFHQHAGTWIETQSEVEELLRRTPVKLCWDVGHAIYGAIDPLSVIRSHADRIAYVHLKDVDGGVLADLRSEGKGFAEGIRRRVFTELGRGCLDVPGVLSALQDIGYDGWLMVEQDTTWLTPLESARTSRTYLRTLGI